MKADIFCKNCKRVIKTQVGELVAVGEFIPYGYEYDCEIYDNKTLEPNPIDGKYERPVLRGECGKVRDTDDCWPQLKISAAIKKRLGWRVG